jgi:hypothetical protein
MTGMPRPTHIAKTVLHVEDIAGSIRFYTDLFAVAHCFLIRAACSALAALLILRLRFVFGSAVVAAFAFEVVPRPVPPRICSKSRVSPSIRFLTAAARMSVLEESPLMGIIRCINRYVHSGAESRSRWVRAEGCSAMSNLLFRLLQRPFALGITPR